MCKIRLRVLGCPAPPTLADRARPSAERDPATLLVFSAPLSSSSRFFPRLSRFSPMPRRSPAGSWLLDALRRASLLTNL